MESVICHQQIKRWKSAMAIVDVECKFCWGAGKIHSPGRNGDPWDKGVVCPKCQGTGVLQEDANDFVPQFEDDE